MRMTASFWNQLKDEKHYFSWPYSVLCVTNKTTLTNWTWLLCQNHHGRTFRQRCLCSSEIAVFEYTLPVGRSQIVSGQECEKLEFSQFYAMNYITIT